MADSRASNFRETLARARAYVNRNGPEPTQSQRTPDRSTSFNDADNLERQMQEDGHQMWGWVIYRCTYESDEQWQAFLERFGYYVHSTLAFHNGEDLKDSLNIQVLADPTTLDGATPGEARQYFQHWSETASMEEQGAPAGLAQRYRYFLHVDQEALESVLAGPEPPEDELGDGYVNIVLAKGIEVEADEEGDEPPLDLGYMRISYTDLLITWYNLFRPINAWATEYRQPPQIGRT